MELERAGGEMPGVLVWGFWGLEGCAGLSANGLTEPSSADDFIQRHDNSALPEAVCVSKRARSGRPPGPLANFDMNVK